MRPLKLQAAMEYLTTYGWAILVIVIIAALLYLYVTTPSQIISSSCVFVSGVYCNDMVMGTNAVSHATTVALFLTNSQPYPMANAVLFAQLNGANTSTAQCSPKYILASGSIVCILNLPTRTTLGQFLAGKFYLNATYCGLNPSYSGSNLCAGAPRETYSGTFQSHAEPLINTNVIVTLTAKNATQAADNAKDPLVAAVDLLGYPLRGATVNFTTNSIGYTINPNYTTTNTTGEALSYIWGTTPGNVVVTASYAGVNGITTIDFVTAFGIQFSSGWQYCPSSGVMITVDGVAYTCPQITSTAFNWQAGSVHSCSLSDPVSGGSGVEGQCSIPSGSCTANSNVVIPITCNTLYQLTMSASPSNGGSVSPGNGWYNAGSPVTISESARSGFDFNGWSGNGYAGASASNTFVIGATTTETASYTTNVVFTETGLPSGTSWSVALNGNPQSSTGDTITFTGLAPGSYPWSTASTISCGAGCQYSASPTSGSVDTASGSASQTITYALSGYDVSFQESGLAAGTSWSVTLNGNTKSSTGTTIDFGYYPSGGYPWSTAQTISCGTGCQYSIPTNSGTVTVASAPVVQTVPYTTQYYLSMSAGSGGTVSPAAPGEWLSAGQSLTITATPNGGYSFNSPWICTGSGCYSGTAASYTFPSGMPGNPVSESASFLQFQTYSNPGGGSGSGNPGTLSCPPPSGSLHYSGDAVYSAGVTNLASNITASNMILVQSGATLNLAGHYIEGDAAVYNYGTITDVCSGGAGGQGGQGGYVGSGSFCSTPTSGQQGQAGHGGASRTSGHLGVNLVAGTGGAGGGGGGSVSAGCTMGLYGDSGGSGGVGGGIVEIYGTTIANHGTISANGGSGQNACTANDDCVGDCSSVDAAFPGGGGGGNGGNGGTVFLGYTTFVGTSPTVAPGTSGSGGSNPSCNYGFGGGNGGGGGFAGTCACGVPGSNGGQGGSGACGGTSSSINGCSGSSPSSGTIVTRTWP